MNESKTISVHSLDLVDLTSGHKSQSRLVLT